MDLVSAGRLTFSGASSMRIVCISDTHEQHREANIPLGDLLIHAGDLTQFSKRSGVIVDFNRWLGELPHPHKIVIFGNHDYALEAEPQLRAQITNATILVNEAALVCGIHVWGSPTTSLYGGAFGASLAKDRERVYSMMPPETEIVVTHSPPEGVLDGVVSRGCPELRRAIERVRPRLHVFGHVHESYGLERTAKTTFVNAALIGVGGRLDRQPIVLELEFARCGLN